MNFWVNNQFISVIFDKEKTAHRLFSYFQENHDELRGSNQVLVGTENNNEENNVWIEMKVCCEGFLYLEVESEDEEPYGTYRTKNTLETIKEAYFSALETFYKQIQGEND